MKANEIVEGLEKHLDNLMFKAGVREYEEPICSTKAAIKFIEPWAELETGFEGIKEKLHNMAPEVNIEIALAVDIKEPEEEETIVTDVSKRLNELDGLPQYEINLSGSREEDERISAYNESLKELANWYAIYRTAVQVAGI